MTHSFTPEVLQGNVRTRLGESPWWDGTSLSWVDILDRKLLRCDLDGDNVVVLDTPGMPGFAIPQTDGAFIVGCPDGLYRVRFSDRPDWARVWICPHNTTTHRLNDGKTDPSGRLWFGSMTYEEKDPVAALYRQDGAEFNPILDRIITSNGLGWSPDGLTMYYTDSIPRVIWKFDVEPDSGDITNQRVFARDPTGYVPDGLTVDNDGCVWSAKWDGGRIVRYTPTGRIERSIDLPVSRPTSCAFTGTDRSILAVTTAMPQDSSRAHPLDGNVLLIPTNTAGPLLHSALPGAMSRSV